MTLVICPVCERTIRWMGGDLRGPRRVVAPDPCRLCADALDRKDSSQ